MTGGIDHVYHRGDHYFAGGCGPAGACSVVGDLKKPPGGPYHPPAVPDIGGMLGIGPILWLRPVAGPGWAVWLMAPLRERPKV